MDLASACGYARCGDEPERGDGDAILALEEALLDAVGRRDGADLGDLLADEFQMTGPALRHPLSKQAWVALAATGRFRAESLSINQPTTVREGGSALVVWRLVQDALYEGRRVAGGFGIVDAWEDRGGRWLLTSRYVRRFGG